MMDGTTAQTINEAVQALTPLAQQLETPAKTLFMWSMKRNYMIAIMDLTLWPILAVLIWGWVWLFRKFRREDPHEEMPWVLVLIFGGIGIGVLGIATVCCSYDSISRFLMPEWNALNDIATMLKPAVNH